MPQRSSSAGEWLDIERLGVANLLPAQLVAVLLTTLRASFGW